MTSPRLLAASVAAVGATAALTACTTGDEPRTNESKGAGAASASYRDGTYEATGWYGGLPSHHDVTVTIADDVITEVSVSTPAEDPTSLAYQRAFAAAVPDVVVGRLLDDVQMDRIAGASGCPQGFMDALEQIKADATV